MATQDCLAKIPLPINSSVKALAEAGEILRHVQAFFWLRDFSASKQSPRPAGGCQVKPLGKTLRFFFQHIIFQKVNIFMATGRSTQLTRQIGEHLIVAKLGRLGYIATPFAGNVPDFDLLIAAGEGHSIPVQVKAINGGSWQFSISKFLDVEIVDDIQYVRGKQELGNPNLVCVFVQLAEDEKDNFFIFQLKDLQVGLSLMQEKRPEY